MGSLVEVARPVPLDRTFTCRLPAAIAAGAEVGRRTLVPFRKRGMTRGFVVGFPESSPVPEADLKDVSALLDDGPALGRDMMELCRFLARHYGCSRGEALDAALPKAPRGRGHFRFI